MAQQTSPAQYQQPQAQYPQAQPYQQAQPYPQQPYPQARPGNPAAVASLVQGIVGLLFFWGGWLFVAVGVAAVVTSVFGSRAAHRGASGGGLATAGLVLGILTLVLQVVMLASVGMP